MIKKLYRQLTSEKQRIALHYALYKVASIWLKGNRYECCCCGKSARRFLPHGDVIVRKNIKCPHCLSLERTRIGDITLDQCMHPDEIDAFLDKEIEKTNKI